MLSTNNWPQLLSGASLLKKTCLIFAFSFAFSLTVSAQTPGSNDPNDYCPEGWVWDGTQCCAIGDNCGPGTTVPPGGDTDNGTPTPGSSDDNSPFVLPICQLSPFLADLLGIDCP